MLKDKCHNKCRKTKPGFTATNFTQGQVNDFVFVLNQNLNFTSAKSIGIPSRSFTKTAKYEPGICTNTAHTFNNYIVRGSCIAKKQVDFLVTKGGMSKPSGEPLIGNLFICRLNLL